MKTLLVHSILTVLLSYLFFARTGALPYNATTAGLVVAFIFLLLWLTAAVYHRSYFKKFPKVISLLVYFLRKVFVANIRVAYDILTPGYQMKPTVIALPLSLKSDLEITLLACMITLTPGTLSLDVSEDRKILYIHALYLKGNDVIQLKAELKNGFERRIIELTT